MKFVCCPEKPHKTIKLNNMKWTCSYIYRERERKSKRETYTIGYGKVYFKLRKIIQPNAFI